MNYYDDIISCCRDLLLNFPQAKEVSKYADSRLSKEGQEKFQFGYFPSFQNLSAIINSIGKERLIELELLYANYSEHKEQHSCMENHNLLIPYKDMYGNIIAAVGRTILNDEQRGESPKYKNTSFKKGNHLFGLYEAKTSILKNDKAYVVEGQFDCITAHDKGMDNVVALGSSSMTFEQFALLLRHTKNIALILDNDDAGRAGVKRIIDNYGKHANISVVELPKPYKDIDGFLVENDIDYFREMEKI
jgi:DNA primase catalytic core